MRLINILDRHKVKKHPGTVLDPNEGACVCVGCHWHRDITRQPVQNVPDKEDNLSP